MKTSTFACVAFILFAANSPNAGAETKREADAHEHGHGALNIAIEGNTVSMELEVPGADIVGFEHAAKSDEDKAKIEAAVEILSAPLKIFAVPDAAGCEMASADVELEGHGDHREFHAKYSLICKAPEKINQIGFSFFEAFPKSEELEVQVVSDKGQSAFEVERDKPVLALK